MKRMLINATHTEELRVALVDGQKLYDLDIESGISQQKKANIYKGKITRIEPSLEAAFVDYGAERHGFLPLKEISKEYFSSSGKASGKINIKEVLSEGQEIIVQVDKEERGNKGAALTTFISLAGRYLVLMPNNSRAGGISRRIEGDERSQLKEAMNGLTTPRNMGVIIRTAGVGRSTDELQGDLDYLCQFWESISHAAQSRSAPFLIFQESNLIIRAVRDYLRQDIGEVLVDDKIIYEDVLNFVRSVMPTYENKIKIYSDEIPLFSRYQIEAQIETAFQREVKLPSGGSIVIDPTEALVSIDINSSRATKGGDIEETALQTNLEAADEIARQLRLRDIGGLIVIDFIDMTPVKNQRDVENRMRQALELDRARVQVGKISRFGLLEMSRQRLRPSLEETRAETCPRCSGQGMIRGVESLALSIMRLIYEEASKDKTGKVQAVVPVSVASFLLNEKRDRISAIEKEQSVTILIIPSAELETPHFEILRIRADETDSHESKSYEIAAANPIEESYTPGASREVVREQAAVTSITPTTQAPVNTEPKSLMKRISARLKALLTGEPNKEESEIKPARSMPKPHTLEGDRPTQNRPPRRERPRRDETPNKENRKPMESNSPTRQDQRTDEGRRNPDRNRDRDRDSRREARRDENNSGGQRNENQQPKRTKETSDLPSETRRPRRDRSERGNQQAREDKANRPTRAERRLDSPEGVETKESTVIADTQEVAIIPRDTKENLVPLATQELEAVNIGNDTASISTEDQTDEQGKGNVIEVSNTEPGGESPETSRRRPPRNRNRQRPRNTADGQLQSSNESGQRTQEQPTSGSGENALQEQSPARESSRAQNRLRTEDAPIRDRSPVEESDNNPKADASNLPGQVQELPKADATDPQNPEVSEGGENRNQRGDRQNRRRRQRSSTRASNDPRSQRHQEGADGEGESAQEGSDRPSLQSLATSDITQEEPRRSAINQDVRTEEKPLTPPDNIEQSNS